MAVDFTASQPQYIDHMAPVWLALPPEHRGLFRVRQALFDHLRSWGIEPSPLGYGGPMLVAGAADLHWARKASAYAYMEHGCGQSYAGDRRMARHTAYAGGDGRDGCSLILAPNEMAAVRWQGRYPSIPVHVIGATRILGAPQSEPCLAVSFHWNGSIPEMVTALRVYRQSLPKLARSLPLIGTGHPRFAHTLEKVYASAGVEWVPDIRDVARRATVYAVDNSSTLWEMGRTRPVITLNAPWYRKHIEHGLRFWSHAICPVEDEYQLADTAARLLDRESPQERRKREAVVADVIPYLDGAQRAARLVVDWLTSLGDGGPPRGTVGAQGGR